MFDQAEGAGRESDVNSGRTRGGGHDFEEIRTEDERRGGAGDRAADPAARPRRDLVVDFIDMMKAANIRKVEKDSSRDAARR
jgi:Ribonuclease G/E